MELYIALIAIWISNFFKILKFINYFPNHGEKDSWNFFKKNFKPNDMHEEIETRKAIISLCISFPKTDDDIATPFRANNVYFRQENGLDL